MVLNAAALERLLVTDGTRDDARGEEVPTVMVRSAAVAGPTVAMDGAGVDDRTLTEEGDLQQIGHFTVLHEIAEGGMGVVYAAHDDQLGRKVAIKLLHARGDHGDQAHERMIREARALARLSHPNVVQVHEVGTFEGKTFVAMEYVEGQTLRRWLEAGPHSWRDVLDIFRQAGQGLAAAHRAGIVHRDFKPDNVVVSKDQRVKVLDFGLARWNADGGQLEGEEPELSHDSHPPDADEERSLTRTGFVLGTPAYMSPEQHEGEAADARSDQFGFCVALYEALYGRRPFPGRTFAKLSRAITKGAPLPPPSGTEVPRWVHQVVMRGLSRDPSERFPSMDALLTGFEDFKASVDAYNTEMLRLESGLGTIMVLAFWILDWMFVPEHVLLALIIRLGIGGAALSVHVLCRRRPRLVERHIDDLSLVINILTGWGMSAIIWLAGGYESGYYAGLNLLVLSLGIMFLWTVRRALLLNGIVYAFYMAPLVLGLVEVRDPSVVLSNQFFLLSTMIIVVAAQRQRYIQQRRQFIAEQERTQLREEVAAMARGRRRVDLYERSQFLLLADDEFQRSRRDRRPVWCVVVGVDGFGELDARYGDEVKDELLAGLRQRLAEDLWRFDLAGRYRGDEFVFLLSDAQPASVRQLTERLLEALGGEPVPTQAGPVALTLSAGLASSSATEHLTTLLSHAISALEQARRAGGARVVVWSGEHLVTTQSSVLPKDVGA
ncbi:protein kinase domain-containing protein [Paraliomyxa miuraensis]|uniref:protein kinase domain-containing protein n=1 Tax=Paraliomyxa miuraensis TaxID=376150 RepID=UPI00225699D4|nr:protein kinase [Paraliomyxa miuraensis]MCX4245173.1 protein kinase [Paraliomyxa miuraensis]